MPGKQQTVRLEQWREPFQYPVLSRLVKVDHHVAAENCVKWTFDIPASVHQIQHPERYCATYAGFDLDQVFPRTGPTQKVFLEQILLNTLNPLAYIYTAFRFLQNRSVDIGSQNANGWRLGPEILGTRDSNRIG